MGSYKDYFAGKRVTLMGLGLLGRGVGDARFLVQCGAELIVTDLKTEEQLAESLAALQGLGHITYHLGGHRLEDFHDRDLVIKAAGVPLDSAYIAEARKNNIPVRMSADLFAQLSGATIVGVTGTRGKSTVSHLIAHIIKTAGKTVLLGGNIRGISTLELLTQTTPDTIVVLELDSWQLQGFGEARLSPHVAVFTTFMPDHMNYYKNDMKAYFADKAYLFLNQTEKDFLILGEQAAPFLKEYGYESGIRARAAVVGVQDLAGKWRLLIPGEHNRYNAALAAAAARALGIGEEDIRKGIETFAGVPGRLELIREVGGIKIYNDTTATVPEATIAALRALDPDQKRTIVLIMGGDDKKLDMSALIREIPAHCSHVVLFKERGTERIRDEVFALESASLKVYEEEGLRATVERAVSVAKPGDTILYSPAFTSFGKYFKNEFDRGEQFNTLIADL